MAMKGTGKTVYKSMRGKQIDIDMLRKKNELTPAVGNARVNARGDELGAGGQIIRKREDVLRRYYQNPAGVKSESVERDDEPDDSLPTCEPTTSPGLAKGSSSKGNKSKARQKAATDSWVEDSDGNFTKKE